MSQFILVLLQHPFFMSTLTQRHIDFAELSKIKCTTIYTEKGIDIKNFVLLDSIEFHHIFLTEHDGKFTISFNTKDSTIYSLSDKYFDSSNNKKKYLDGVYQAHGYSRRKYSDEALGYNIYITNQKKGDEFLVTMIFDYENKT